MTTESDINQRCKELFELMQQRKPDQTRVHVLLLELRALSDKTAKDGEVIPVEPFEMMGPELRMCCFDVFLGLAAASIGVVLPEIPN